MTTRVKYLSLSIANNLYDSVDENIERYTSGDFSDLASQGGWSAELSCIIDDLALSRLVMEKGPNAELENSLIVGSAMRTLPPSVATEARLWARIAHVECLEYCRTRWLTGVAEDKLESAIRTHFFAFSLTQYRDDHAVSRLWWNYYIISRLYPEDIHLALSVVLKTADIRSNFIERPWITTRINLARGILRSMLNDPWVTAEERHFREFMKAVNRLGSGVVFENLDEKAIDKIIQHARLNAEDNVGKH